jgi:serine/threonine-protein kinase
VVGELIADRYELERLVGTGGMSSVYCARDRLLERKVALKMLHEHRTGDDVERFRHEARAAAQLAHPNIVTVIDRGEQDGRQFIVFEFVDGENLKELVEREGPLPVRDAVELALQVGEALAVAHEHGLVHRDVKPQNVLLNDDGRAKVTDFGIARDVDVEGMTTSGMVLGTSEYIAPEQARGDHVGPHTDLYSLGVVLYELLTGEVPFRGDNFVAIAMRHVNDPVPTVRERRPDVPPRLDAAVRKAMAKDPADRWDSMDEFLAELEACRAELDAGEGATMVSGPLPSPLPPTVRRERRTLGLSLPLAVAVIAAVVLAAALVAALTIGVGDVGHIDGIGKSSPPAPKVHLSGVTAYDPEGDNSEHNDMAGQATDNNPTTYWQTQEYSNSNFGNLKSGVGLVLDAGRSVALKKLSVTTTTSGFTALVKVGNSESGPSFTVDSPSATVSGTTNFSLNGRKGRYYLLWITNLGPNSAVHVNEVKAR